MTASPPQPHGATPAEPHAAPPPPAAAVRVPGTGRYLPISDYGTIGDLHTAALVGRNGSIDWYCPRSFDSPSVFAAILDAARGGACRIEPTAPYTTEQRYLAETAVLVTTFRTATGVVELTDFMPISPAGRRVFAEIHRRVECVSGQVEVRVLFKPCFDYATGTSQVQPRRHGLLATDAEDEVLTLASPAEIWWTLDDGAASATLKLSATAAPVSPRPAHAHPSARAVMTGGDGGERAAPTPASAPVPASAAAPTPTPTPTPPPLGVAASAPDAAGPPGPAALPPPGPRRASGSGPRTSGAATVIGSAVGSAVARLGGAVARVSGAVARVAGVGGSGGGGAGGGGARGGGGGGGGGGGWGWEGGGRGGWSGRPRVWRRQRDRGSGRRRQLCLVRDPLRRRRSASARRLRLEPQARRDARVLERVGRRDPVRGALPGRRRALGGDAQAHVLRPDGRDRRRADDVASRGDRRRPKLGLSVHLDPGFGVCPLLPQYPRSLGRGGPLHGVPEARRAAHDRHAHPGDVRDRWPPPSDRADARAPRRLPLLGPGPDWQRGLRPAPTRRLWGAAGDGLPLEPDPPGDRGHLGHDRAPRELGGGQLASARQRHLGSASRASALRAQQGDVLGGAGPRHPDGA